MKLFFRAFIPALFLVALTGSKGIAQTKDLSAQEQKLAKQYDHLTDFIQGNYDSLQYYSGKFEKEFTAFLRNTPATLTYSFKKLIDDKVCNIKTSDDGNFRIYSWDTWTGGTMHIFNEVYQWKANDKVFIKVPVRENGDGGNFCSNIYTVTLKNRICYLAVTNAVYSTKDAMQSISGYTIQNGQLNDTVKVFKTKTKKLNRIDVGFDFFSVADRPERPLELVRYDEEQQLLYIPVVLANGQVTRKNLLYQLKDQYLEYIGIDTGMRE